jgi:hypothetical protein
LPTQTVIVNDIKGLNDFQRIVSGNYFSENGVIDQTGLPLDQIAADLAKIQNKSFRDKEIRFAYFGTEKGKILHI